MKCHYEVLEISREADDGEIKSAYRKQALKWHPDKNLDNADFAKEQFQLVQQAYEVLSDKQERAWYDAHRDQILRGSNSEFQDRSLDVFQYFTTTCFKSFGDDENGFYTVYRKVFDQVAKEDIEFMDKEEFTEIPGFGKSDSDYDEVVKHFYDYWMSYSTKKSYSWLDPYDIREGRGDRRLLKIIEKENKKARQKFRKERNEEIRNLVAFVRKRDKRVQAYKKAMEEKNLENRKKQHELNKQRRLERNQQHAVEKQGEWMKFDNVKSQLEEMEKHLAQEFGEELSNSEEETEALSNLYCVACNKVFKNPKAFENHESSKKHKENIEILTQVMLEEEEENLSDIAEDNDMEEDREEDDLLLDQEEQKEEFSEETTKVSESSDEDDKSNSKPQKKSKKKKSKNVIVAQMEEAIETELDISKVCDDDFDFGTSKSQRKKSNKKNNTNKSKLNTNTVDKTSTGSTVGKEEIPKGPSIKERKKDRKKNKRDSDISEIDTNHCCVTCKGNFPSKNKLFDHLKKSGHGVYLSSKKATKKTIAQNEL
ncbi:hypothetical protein GWI33_015136 [Rhynchophorus ferrugineus]|uniref:DnaJ homolog subfamily C member 21 n=1 Tax=Rhynchophorus ferrugineus TaxID=354439 RepID=A0A834I603_RHYFE|nr:hypothetical protein GWI33_015136 [Rhynchophorus ferrugineus]